MPSSRRPLLPAFLAAALLLAASFASVRPAAAAAAAAGRGGANFNPYDVLGVPRDAAQGEIKRQYRELCLRLHPDKNVDKGPRERERREEAFKTVQRANSLIGDEESRRRYDAAAASPFGGPGAEGGEPFGGAGAASGGRPYYGPSPSEAFFRSFYGAQMGRRAYYPARRSPFYFNGVDISDLFPGGLATPDSPKSVFVERVKVPLEELYTGVRSKVFILSDSIWQRYRAAFRGGIAGPLGLQGLMISAPMLLRTSLPLSLAAFLISFHLSLPRPMRLFYRFGIQPGWRGGTRVKFEGAEPGVDVVFVIDEGRHDRYARDGDDLRTATTIGSTTAREGGTVLVEPLSREEGPIAVRLGPGEVRRSGDVVTVRGRGWPKRRAGGGSGGSRGDLKVVFTVVSDEEAERLRQRGENGSKTKRRRWKRRWY